jgi:hypothetical protein
MTGQVTGSLHPRFSSLVHASSANLVRHGARYRDRGLGLAGTRLAGGSARACHIVPLNHKFLDFKPIKRTGIAFAADDFVAWSVSVQR